MTQTHRSDSLTRLLHRGEAGAVAGLIGAVVVAVIFFLDGAIRLHPLAVPSVLASGLFGSTNGGSATLNGDGTDVVSVVKMVEYTAAHLLTFMVVGISAAFVLDGARFWKSVWAGAAYVGALCTGLLYIVSWISDMPVAVDVLGLPRVVLANMLAGAMIGVALYMAEHSHTPKLGT